MHQLWNTEQRRSRTGSEEVSNTCTQSHAPRARAHLPGLGLHDLSAPILGALGKSNELLLGAVLKGRRLAEQRQNGHARVAAHHRNLHIRHRQALLLSVEGPCAHLRAQAAM